MLLLAQLAKRQSNWNAVVMYAELRKCLALKTWKTVNALLHTTGKEFPWSLLKGRVDKSGFSYLLSKF
jgi:hypothetical protein